MQLLLWILCSMTLLFSEGISSHHFSEKLIVSSSKDKAMSEEELLKLKVYFIENPTTRILQEKHHLGLELEKLGDYYMVVIKPIKSLSLRNDLTIVLTPMFQDIFFIDYPEHMQIKNTQVGTGNNSGIQPATQNIYDNKKVSFIDEIGLQWLALLILSIIGLILSINSRKKILTLGVGQKDIQVEQNIIEIEIKNLGAKDA